MKTERRPHVEHVDRARAAPGARARMAKSGEAHSPTSWWEGRPLSEGKNAHKTNTAEQFNAAMKDGSNWFEGDIRKELHGKRVEMRHDETAETGDNLTLKQWLSQGKASGRGLKLDVKDSYEMPTIMKETKAAHIPSERLMWNLGDGELKDYGKQVRREFPKSTIAINTRPDGDKMGNAEVNRMIAHAKQVGQPVTFVVRYDRLTPAAVKKLEQVAPISVWNEPSQGHLQQSDVARVAHRLRAEGVTGIIDLRKSDTTLDKIEAGVDKAKNVAGEWARQRFHDAGNAARDVVDDIGDLL